MAPSRQVRAVAVTVLGLGATAAVVAVCRPGAVPVSADDPTSGVVAAAGWAAWAMAAYLLLAIAAGAAAHLPGRLGRAGAGARPLLPRVLARGVDAVIGVSLAAAAITAVPAAAQAAAPAPAPVPPVATAASPLDWPGLLPAPASPASPRPAVGLVSAGASRPQPASDHTIVVRPGDSLWALTARLLGPSPAPAQIAAHWPRLYAANRAVIGPDPDLIHPGQRLVPPPLDERNP